jgi:glycosyltransferase involved in cell wall biosynthesis
MSTKLKIAAFGFRTLPPSKGAAGADKFALELYPRLVKMGYSVVAYNRRYPDVFVDIEEYNGIKIKTFRTLNIKGFDTLLHSFKCTLDIILKNTGDIVHIQNGGNSIWALPLRLFGKKVFISQDGVDWKRGKWPWYGRLYLLLSAYLTSVIPNQVIFDNIFAKKIFENRFKKKFEFIPFGSEIAETVENNSILDKYQLKRGEYYLFVGRFIPDKGLHYLIPAFDQSNSTKKLVLVGGSPNPSQYEKQLLKMANDKVIFAGFVYGDDVTNLMKNAYCYIQPSDVEGLSPVILTVMGLDIPLIVSDIDENLYAIEGLATTFEKGNVISLSNKIIFVEKNYEIVKELALKAQVRALTFFNWDKVALDHIKVFHGEKLLDK